MNRTKCPNPECEEVLEFDDDDPKIDLICPLCQTAFCAHKLYSKPAGEMYDDVDTYPRALVSDTTSRY